MALSYIFLISGLAIAVLLAAKRIEEKSKKSLFVLRLISRGEERCREMHHKAVAYYSSGKEKAHFLVVKQLPRYSRSSLNKTLARFEDSMGKYLEHLRDSRLLKKSDGISEFFKTMSEVEKGGGEINQDIYIEEFTSDNTQPVVAEEPKPKRERKPRTKKAIKLVVHQEAEETLV